MTGLLKKHMVQEEDVTNCYDIAEPSIKFEELTTNKSFWIYKKNLNKSDFLESRYS